MWIADGECRMEINAHCFDRKWKLFSIFRFHSRQSYRQLLQRRKRIFRIALSRESWRHTCWRRLRSKQKTHTIFFHFPRQSQTQSRWYKMTNNNTDFYECGWCGGAQYEWSAYLFFIKEMKTYYGRDGVHLRICGRHLVVDWSVCNRFVWCSFQCKCAPCRFGPNT